jgi:hypothetical protein
MTFSSSIVEPILYVAEIEFDALIEAWPAQELLGVAVKLRYALEQPGAERDRHAGSHAAGRGHR